MKNIRNLTGRQQREWVQAKQQYEGVTYGYRLFEDSQFQWESVQTYQGC